MIRIATVASALLAVSLPARAGSKPDHDDKEKCKSGSVTVTPLAAGDAHCRFGGVKIATCGGTEAFSMSVPVPMFIPGGGNPKTIAVVDLPPGNYVIEAKGQLSRVGEGLPGDVRCTISSATTFAEVDSQLTTVAGFTTTALLGPYTTPPAGDQVQLQCSTSNFSGASIDNAELVAVQVSSLHSTVVQPAARRRR